jgi:thiol reductant ABC exporter CydD subunit
MAATGALGVCATLLTVAQAALLAHVITAVFAGGRSLSAETGALAALAAVAVGRGLVASAFESAGRAGAAKVMAELRAALVQHLLRARGAGLERERRGELVTSAVHGVDALESYFARYLPQVVLAALAPLVILVWVLPRDWVAAAILAGTFPLIPVFMVLVGRLAAHRTRERWRTLAALSGHFLDVVSGLATLRAFGRAGHQERALADSADRYRRETMATLRVAFLSALVLELLAMLGVALVAATVGVQLAEGTLGLEAGLTVLILAPEVYAPLRELGAQFHASTDGLAAAERIFAVLDRPAAVSDPEHALPAPDPRSEPVLLEDVGFTYEGSAGPVLEHTSLVLGPGETVALVGPSGAGKTTLAALLLRLADPSSGRVSCGGVDLRDVRAQDWHDRIAWVPQRPTIFSGSIAENIGMGNRCAGAAELRAAAAAAGVLEFADRLPDGLETRVGEGGRRLSAGQAQRIALARAFVRDAPLVVLDEPTANLDGRSAALVDEAIGRLLRDRTALLIAHRPALAARADRIVEMAPAA